MSKSKTKMVLEVGEPVERVPSDGYSILLMKNGVVQGTYPVIHIVTTSK
jgi:hypothetical protein